MSFEHSFLSQHGLTVAFAAALLATACGGTFTGTGGAGGSGASAGAGAGGSSAGAGGGPICNAACPLIACPGSSSILPGECCPTCDPSGGAGGMSSGGASGGSGCLDVPCDDIGCGPGWISVYQGGACCPSCVPDGGGSGGVGGCGNIGCPAIACGKGYMLQESPDSCCPTCVPNDACTQGQQSYDQLREKLISQPGAVACKVSNDCAFLSGNAYCGDECSAIPVNAAAAQSLDSQLSAYAAKNCSTCTPEYPPCAAPLPPTCIDGQCVNGAFRPN